MSRSALRYTWRMRSLVRIATAGCLVAAIPLAGAETPPRIGLALSGGGARGLAHVGVLKVLEELRVPVHCITGTSMGAIVGGTYASGTPATKLEEKVREADWDDLFRDRPPRAELSSRRKSEDYTSELQSQSNLVCRLLL